MPDNPSIMQLSKVSLFQVLLVLLLRASNVTCRPSGEQEDRLGSVLDILWPFESLEKAQGNAGDNVVAVEDRGKNEEGRVLKREVVNQNSEDQVIRRPVVRLGTDNLPYVFYADNEVVKVAKVVRKMVRKRKRKKKVFSAPPLDIRDRPQRRRPKLVLMNSEGQAMPPVLMHLNDRIAPVYSFKSRSDVNGNENPSCKYISFSQVQKQLQIIINKSSLSCP